MLNQIYLLILVTISGSMFCVILERISSNWSAWFHLLLFLHNMILFYETITPTITNPNNSLTRHANQFNIQGGPIKCYHFSIIPKFSNVNLFKIFIQRFVIRNIKPTFNINEFVKSELCRERNKDLCSVCF